MDLYNYTQYVYYTQATVPWEWAKIKSMSLQVVLLEAVCIALSSRYFQLVTFIALSPPRLLPHPNHAQPHACLLSVSPPWPFLSQVLIFRTLFTVSPGRPQAGRVAVLMAVERVAH